MPNDTTEWFVATALLALSQRRTDEAQRGAIAAPDAAFDAQDDAAASAADADPFATRLWRLLRTRRALTADEAAELLVDTNDDLAQARRRAGALLLTWSRQCPKAIRIGAKRVDGLKRYALQRDIGATPPAARGATP